LTEKRAEIDHFRETLKSQEPALTEDDWEYCSDVVLHRYLVAREFDEERSLQLLLGSFSWRKVHIPRYASCSACIEKDAHPMVWLPSSLPSSLPPPAFAPRSI